MWDKFHFSGNPYEGEALRANKEGYSLFTGRAKEAEQFLTQVDSGGGAVVVLSGDGGVGKTSFFNVQQYRISEGIVGYGPKIAPAIDIVALDPAQGPDSLARRIVEALVDNVESHCATRGVTVPERTARAKEYLSLSPDSSGFDWGFTVAGIGGNVARSFSVPPPDSATLHQWHRLIQMIASEVREKNLGLDGAMICLDNAEAVETKDLIRLLKAFRDTLFEVEGIWWTIIGPSGLYAEIDRADQRVSGRITGTGIELSPMSAVDLHQLIETRVAYYGSEDGQVSPLSQEIHRLLFSASQGETRFVLKTADALVRMIVSEVRRKARADLSKKKIAASEVIAEVLQSALQDLVENGIGDDLATIVLSGMALDGIRGKALDESAVTRLAQIGPGRVLAGDYSAFGFETDIMFLESFLEPLRSQGLLARTTEAKNESTYRLKGVAWLCDQLELFEEVLCEEGSTDSG